jgi:hypothetical protein
VQAGRGPLCHQLGQPDCEEVERFGARWVSVVLRNGNVAGGVKEIKQIAERDFRADGQPARGAGDDADMAEGRQAVAATPAGGGQLDVAAVLGEQESNIGWAEATLASGSLLEYIAARL